MKNILIAAFLLISYLGNGQDIFQSELFSADLVLKYRDQIELKDSQVKAIKKVYNDNISNYNSLRWDLDAETVKMKTLLAESSMDSTASMFQMNKILTLETSLKQQRLSMLLSIKNQLSESQQTKLKELKKESGDMSPSLITPINENPRVVVRVSGDKSKGEPLYYVIDKKGRQKVDSKFVENLDPKGIESMEVLKGESAKEQFGKEGENGVILIKLKEN